MKIPPWVKPGVWGVVVGAVAWWAVLSFGFGWVSASTAKQMADDQAQTKVVAALVPACALRFEQQPNAVAAWSKLSKTGSYDRGDFVKDGHWDAAPGQKLSSEVANGVAAQCAEQVLQLTELNGVKLTAAK